MSIGDTTLRGTNEAECPRVYARLRASAEFGATDSEIAAELPFVRNWTRVDEAVSSRAAPIPSWELALYDACERVREVLPDSEDMFAKLFHSFSGIRLNKDNHHSKVPLQRRCSLSSTNIFKFPI